MTGRQMIIMTILIGVICLLSGLVAYGYPAFIRAHYGLAVAPQWARDVASSMTVSFWIALIGFVVLLYGVIRHA